MSEERQVDHNYYNFDSKYFNTCMYKCRMHSCKQVCSSTHGQGCMAIGSEAMAAFRDRKSHTYKV